MVKAKIVEKNNKINSFVINGHAEGGDYGHDLVCAAITGIVTGSLNAFDIQFKSNVEIDVKENEISIKIVKDDELLNNLLEFMLIQLETIQVQYPKNFKIERMI
ncbi:ribosomal-processing cysteine protease Prp [Spiroplasma sp. BIUS-1]|uniref:ribosomal-processing cysteine protease Prp n=1 Tax=Spiroplasma sp. BIUS-1 TaxID=216964 RepID=UPI001398B939|nr:ribosomal-processing cysteine protease Prp [Spiroplasma sp. BIUS-1]QHX36462.1 ribosomal-processing cysteine protease Prp [Spiroplasma sp. BIUS-1]